MSSKRTDTTSLPSISLSLPSGPVTFKFPHTTANRLSHTIISIPPHSHFTPGLHWHELYDEFFRVLRGRVRITLSGHSQIYTPESGVLRIPKFARHEFMRADAAPDIKGDGDEGWVEVEEWTEPDDGFHEVFFRNVMSVVAETTVPNILSAQLMQQAQQEREGVGERHTQFGVPRVGLSTAMQLWTSIAYMDNYIVLPVLPAAIGHHAIHGIFGLGAMIGKAIGMKPWYEEYTPPRLRQIAAAGAGGSVKIS